MAKIEDATQLYESGLVTYTPRERNMYLTGMFGQNMIYNVIVVVLGGYYLSNVLYIPAATVGIILALAQVWDAFNDPMMGTIVDKTRSKWGKCRPYLIFVPAVIGVISVLNYLNGSYDGSQPANSPHNLYVVLWAGAAYILWGMCYTAGDIPLWGIVTLMTENEKHRQKLQMLSRTVAAVAGGIGALALQPVAIAVGQALNGAGLIADKRAAEKTGFILVGSAFILIGVAAFQMTGLFARERIKPSEKSYTLRENFQLMWRNKPFRQVLLSGVLAGPRNIMMNVAMVMVTYYYASKNPAQAVLYLALLGGGLFGALMTAQIMVPRLSQRFSKKTLYNFANLVGVVPSLLLFALYMSNPGGMTKPLYLVLTMLIFAFNGVGLGLYMVLQSNMIADAVDYEDYTNHVRPDGVFFSGQTFITKIGTAISVVIFGLLKDFVGFSDVNVKALDKLIDTGVVPREVMGDASFSFSFTEALSGVTTTITGPQIEKFMMVMFLAIAVPPAVSGLLAVIPTWKYALSKEKLEEIVAELHSRRIAEGELTE
ncbi:MAG: MFS transporter [Oscillospiraceae bacterium]|jgi:sugar (glycoside-pentoside-hexuronide) transporter|nr:MFS transporter [Oscillospiraceae bacterium]